MAKHQWTIVCQQAIVDRFTNNLTIVGVVEQVNIELQKLKEATEVRKQPVVPTSFSLVSMWHRSDTAKEERSSGRLSIKNPKGKTLFATQQQEIDLTGDKLRARNIFNFRGFPLEESGSYRVYVQTLLAPGKWKTVATIEIPVRISVLEGSGKTLN